MSLKGHLDQVSHRRIDGWAWEDDVPTTPVSLIIAVNDRVIGRVLADTYRQDLATASIGDGHHSFSYVLAESLSPLQNNVVSVRREGDGAHIFGSPRALASATSLSQEARTAIEELLLSAADETDIAERLEFLNAQIDKLRQLSADRRSGLDARERRHAQQWSEALPELPRKESQRPKRALVIDEQSPALDRDAGSNAVFSHIRSLKRIGYEVTFASIAMQGDVSVLANEGVICCHTPWYFSVEEVLNRQRDSFDLVYLHRIATANLYVGLARHLQKRARIIYSVADLHALRFARQADVEDRPELLALSRRLQTLELMASWQADAVITHSTAEALYLGKHMPPEKVHTVLWSVTVKPTEIAFSERNGVAFIGGYQHRPNVDAAHWIADKLMPELDALGANIPCLLVGSEMPDSVRNLAQRNLEIIGYVPKLATVFDRVRLTVAPLAYGAGVKGKVLDSLVAGVPCACTPAAAEGLNFRDTMCELIAANPVDLARLVQRLHEDEVFHLTCREAGLAYITENACDDAVDKALRKAARA